MKIKQVIFWHTDKCRYCKPMSGLIAEYGIAEHYKGRYTERNPHTVCDDGEYTPQEFGVNGVPCLTVLFKDGNWANINYHAKNSRAQFLEDCQSAGLKVSK